MAPELSEKVAKPRPAYVEARSLFVLQDPEFGTEREWELYIANRQEAGIYRGINGSEEYNDDWDESGWSVQVLESIGETLGELEEEMGLKDGVLERNFKMIYSNAEFEDVDEPRTVTTLTRIYSPSKPVYIDVHLDYHRRTRYNSVEWCYRLGFKIHTRPGTNDFNPPYLKNFRGRPESAYASDGWRPLAYGYWDDDESFYSQRRNVVERKGFAIGREDILDVYEAMWGPFEESEDIPEDTDEVTTSSHHRKMVDVVRLLLGAVGIDYKIACTDTEKDIKPQGWLLDGNSNGWLARETRKTCGFRLSEDLEDERHGQRLMQQREMEEEEPERQCDDSDCEDDECDGIHF